MAEDTYDDLVRDLAALGRAIDPPASPATSGDRRDGPGRRPPASRPERWAGDRQFARRVVASLESRRRRIALVVAAVLIALLATPPVRAAVADWFGFGGVVVEHGSPGPGPAPPPPEVPGGQSRWQRPGMRSTSPCGCRRSSGTPDGVEVSADRRIVSMSWSGDPDGVVRLDQFDGRFDFSLAKRAPDVIYASVGGTDALWFEEPHEVVLLEPDGTRRTESARLAGHTLIWQDGDTTLRIEGELALERAVEIAESAVPGSLNGNPAGVRRCNTYDPAPRR